jgi:Big-like domain-containing protein
LLFGIHSFVDCNTSLSDTYNEWGKENHISSIARFNIIAEYEYSDFDKLATSHIVTYTPQAGFKGSDRFTYKATDPQGVDSNIATVDITVT